VTTNSIQNQTLHNEREIFDPGHDPLA